MTLRFGSIIIHKPDPNSETDNSMVSSDDAEVAEIAETAILKYNQKKQSIVRKSERQRRTINKNNRSTNSRRSSVSSSSSGGEVPILRLMKSDSSPPLVRSHYSQQAEDGLQKDVPLQRNRRRTCANPVSANEYGSERLGFRVLTSGPRTSDAVLDRRHTASAVPDVTSSLTTPFVPLIDDEAAIKGISKLLKNLNIAEKLRQQKAEQQRLDVHKLPNHMKEQLKHIYVY